MGPSDMILPKCITHLFFASNWNLRASSSTERLHYSESLCEILFNSDI